MNASDDGRARQVPFFKVASERGPAQHALAQFAQHADAIASAMTRALPFLVRRGAPVTFDEPTLVSADQGTEALEQPTYECHFATEESHLRGLLAFDRSAMATLLDGFLGGEGGAPERGPAEEERTGRPRKLSSAQQAFMARVAPTIVAAISSALHSRTGLRLAVVDPLGMGEDVAQTTAVRLDLRFASETCPGRIVFTIDARAFRREAPGKTSVDDAPDARVLSTLDQVELDVVVELGRLRLPLRDVEALRVGSTLLLDAHLGGLVSVRSQNQVLLRGRPTTESGRIAVRIR